MNNLQTPPLMAARERAVAFNESLDEILADVVEGRLTKPDVLRSTLVKVAEEHSRTYSEVLTNVGLRVQLHLQARTYSQAQIDAIAPEARSCLRLINL